MTNEEFDRAAAQFNIDIAAVGTLILYASISPATNFLEHFFVVLTVLVLAFFLFEI